MTPENIQFVREMQEILSHPGQYLLRRETTRLLALLIESEGMKMKAEYWERGFYHNLSDVHKENWADEHWIAAARKELLG